METDHFVLIDRGTVYITERRSRQVLPDCLFSRVVFNSVQLYLSMQLNYSGEPWHCGVQREERIVHAFA